MALCEHAVGRVIFFFAERTPAWSDGGERPDRGSSSQESSSAEVVACSCLRRLAFPGRPNGWGDGGGILWTLSFPLVPANDALFGGPCVSAEAEIRTAQEPEEPYAARSAGLGGKTDASQCESWIPHPGSGAN